jgi:hypothetical protein
MKTCLNENEISQAIEWIAEVGDEELPDYIKNHLENCIA